MRQLKTENYSVILCRIQFGPCICIFRYAKSFSNWARALYRVVVSLSLQSMRCCLANKQTFNPTAADMYSRIPHTTGAQRPHRVSQSIWFMRFVSIVEVNVCTVFFFISGFALKSNLFYVVCHRKSATLRTVRLSRCFSCVYLVGFDRIFYGVLAILPASIDGI